MENNRINRAINIVSSNSIRPHITLNLPVSAPISVERRTSTGADGIGSPSDLAYTPPGVLTKVENIVRARTPARHSPEKMLCACCGRNSQCFCKKCTLEKLTFYAKKETLYNSSVEKTRLQKEIEGALTCSTILHEISKKRERMLLLKAKIKDVKARKDRTESEIVRLKNAETAKETDLVVIIKKQENRISDYKVGKSKRELKLTAVEQTTATLRRQLCAQAALIFPVMEMMVDFRDSASKNCAAWAMIRDDKLAGRGFEVRNKNAYINDAKREQLGQELTGGPVSLSVATRPAFTAIIYAFHLVHLLGVIFNATLPSKFSLCEISTRDRWHKEKLKQEWSMLCDAVMLLCIHIGMEQSEIVWAQPFSNLIEFVNYVLTKEADISNIERKPEINLEQILAGIGERIKEFIPEDDDNAWEIVN